MPEPAETNGEPMGGKTELEQLQFKANQVTDESLESTRRMMALCDESKEAGIRTLVALDDQGEQMDRIEEDMDKINADMKEAEKNLEGMEKCCGICVCPCNKSSDFKEDASTWKASEDGKIVNNQPARVMDDRNGAGPMGGYIAKEGLKNSCNLSSYWLFIRNEIALTLPLTFEQGDQRCSGGGDGGQHAAGEHHDWQLAQHGHRHGKRDGVTEQATGQDQLEGQFLTLLFLIHVM
ncbi:synaptosomal-associated protein 25 [Caerostris extrusa]|uniref:Synaptosomal-associated protein n=5 Tax=Araneoidea TaxID=74975 RepID=A0AAV4MDL9_CAEEX|nr:synaptosomal-associated protein 25 [Caerostris extrusa]